MSGDGPPTRPLDLTAKTLHERANMNLEASRKAYQEAAETQLKELSQNLSVSGSKLVEQWGKQFGGALNTTTTAIKKDLTELEHQTRRITQGQVARAQTKAKTWMMWGLIGGGVFLLIGLMAGIWLRFTLPTPPGSVPTQTIIRGGSTYETIGEKGWTICKKTGRPCKKLKD